MLMLMLVCLFRALCSSSSKMLESKLNILVGVFLCIIFHYEITDNIKFYSRFKQKFGGRGIEMVAWINVPSLTFASLLLVLTSALCYSISLFYSLFPPIL